MGFLLDVIHFIALLLLYPFFVLLIEALLLQCGAVLISEVHLCWVIDQKVNHGNKIIEVPSLGSLND